MSSLRVNKPHNVPVPPRRERTERRGHPLLLCVLVLSAGNFGPKAYISHGEGPGLQDYMDGKWGGSNSKQSKILRSYTHSLDYTHTALTLTTTLTIHATTTTTLVTHTDLYLHHTHPLYTHSTYPHIVLNLTTPPISRPCSLVVLLNEARGIPRVQGWSLYTFGLSVRIRRVPCHRVQCVFLQSGCPQNYLYRIYL